MDKPLIEHISDMPNYAPPAHVGTSNIRLVEKEFCGSFEMVRGVVQPGGEAEPHYHEIESQVMYVIAGEADVTLGEGKSVICGPGTIVRIPYKLLHRVVAAGNQPLEVVIVYSPPLPAKNAFHQAK
jgi:mannose-6-phosphate isomerase-like protein (cupin superfamily)